MKKYVSGFLFLFSILFVNPGFAQIIRIRATHYSIQYDRTDIEIELKARWNNPYLQEEVALDMLITTPSGENRLLPCYYQSGESGQVSVWKARFTPQEVGKYLLRFRLTESEKILQISKGQTLKVRRSDKTGFLHTKDYWTLQFDNGKPFRGIGENICWESRDTDDSKYFNGLHEKPDIYNYEYMLPKFARNGGNFFRTWICHWNLPIDYKGPFNNRRYTPSDEFYNPSASAKMDRLVGLCDSLQLYMMLTLGQGGYLEKDGGVAVSAEDFFINPKSKERYKNRLRYIVARWGYSPSIAMWEFFNEVDNVQFGRNHDPIKSEYIVQWHDEMSRYLKTIDPYRHIITTSISHRDIEGLNSIENMDINQKHIYKNTSSIPEEINRYTAEFKKPYIIGEFGYEWDWNKNFNDFADEMDTDFKRGLWYGLFSPTPVTPMSWWWEFFDSRNMVPYFQGVREISDKMLAAGNGSFESLSVKADNIRALGVRCGETLFVYLFNERTTPVTTNITIENPKNRRYEIQEFDPASRIYKPGSDAEYVASEINIKKLFLGAGQEKVWIILPK
ncbi:MAG: DUF5060 domain-containing protein [Candidatus Azobacteroides sp.]|nr:DUF5060 domain-containing protein [Candidatus Azobacteroides sp.]